MEHPSWEERKKAVSALGEIQDKESVDYLIKALNFKAIAKGDDIPVFNLKPPDLAKSTRKEAAFALGKIGGK